MKKTACQTNMNCDFRKTGFTLLEVIILVVVLGIIARVVIPQFTEASTDAREASLKENLKILRAQLELYKNQHMGEYPCGHAKTPVAPEKFIHRMTIKTDACHQKEGIFGPYLEEFLTNPFNGLNTVRYGSNPGANKAGWCFDPATGAICADDKDFSQDGKPHSLL